MITSKKLTAERIAEIEKVPVEYDEDSPKFTKEELNEFAPYHKEYFDIMAQKAADGCKGSFVPLSKEDIVSIYEAAL